MADSEFSSVHWDSPPPTSLPDVTESNHINNGLTPTSPPAQPVPPEMDPLQAPPSNDHILICVRSLEMTVLSNRPFHPRKRRQTEQKMLTFHILLLLRSLIP